MKDSSTEKRVQKVTDMIIDSMTLLNAQDREDMLSDLMDVISKYMPKMKSTVGKTKYPDGLLYVRTHIRHCEDADIDNITDIDDFQMREGAVSLMPCMTYNEETGEYFWEPIIDVSNGKIINWKKGKTANVCYKVVDECALKYQKPNGTQTEYVEDYVPDFLSPDENGYGDYMYMSIDENGYIADWNDNEAKNFVESNLL